MKRSFVFLIWCTLTGFIFVQACQSGDEIRKKRYYTNGKKAYEQHCANCHGLQGEGLAALYPPLTDSSYLKNNRSKLACIIRFGIQDSIVVAGKGYSGTMPANTTLAPIDIAYLINYICNSFGNQSSFYSQEQVQADLKQCAK